MEVETILFVGTHIDDIELAAGGTVQILKERGYEVVGLMCSSGVNEEQAKERIEAGKKTSKIIGYTPVFGGLMEPEISIENIQEIVKENIREYQPDIVFGHSPKDLHYHHVDAAIGTLSGARSVRNYLYFTGPLRKTTFSPQIFFTFGETEFQKKLKALKVQKEVYGNTRYFTLEYTSEAAWLGQKANFYKERENAPLITMEDKEEIPYAEGFEVERLVDPF